MNKKDLLGWMRKRSEVNTELFFKTLHPLPEEEQRAFHHYIVKWLAFSCEPTDFAMAVSLTLDELKKEQEKKSERKRIKQRSR